MRFLLELPQPLLRWRLPWRIELHLVLWMPRSLPLFYLWHQLLLLAVFCLCVTFVGCVLCYILVSRVSLGPTYHCGGCLL